MATEETKPVEREAFEEWYRGAFPGRRQPEWFVQDRRYFYGQANDAWEVWQASAAAALERAARATRCYKCEAEIRALKGSR